MCDWFSQNISQYIRSYIPIVFIIYIYIYIQLYIYISLYVLSKITIHSRVLDGFPIKTPIKGQKKKSIALDQQCFSSFGRV